MSKMKILIVEDETIVALDIKNAIKKLGYIASNVVTNHTDALQCVQDDEPDIILMDIYLENSKDGIETAIDIQKIKNIPIIYLTAYSDDETISRAVKTSPVSYLQKPFKRDDLKSALALCFYKIDLENKKETLINYKEIGFDYYYDFETKNLYYKKLPIKLGVKENLLLNKLIEADGNIVSFKEIEHLLWQNNSVSDSSLRTIIYRLRNKLEHKLIETIPSFGIRLINI